MCSPARVELLTSWLEKETRLKMISAKPTRHTKCTNTWLYSGSKEGGSSGWIHLLLNPTLELIFLGVFYHNSMLFMPLSN